MLTTPGVDTIDSTTGLIIYCKKGVMTMHYHAEVWLKELKNINEQIEKIMQPYDENLEGFWDWWQIGGRWTGIHTGYEPDKDPLNIEECSVCGGTGKRMDKLGVAHRKENPDYTCNGCDGEGQHAKWPTQYAAYHGDVIHVSQIKDDLTCYTLIVNGDVFHKEIWTGDEWEGTGFSTNVKDKLKELGINDGFLVTVDYHC